MRGKSKGKGSIYVTIGVKQYRVTPAQLTLFTHLRELGFKPEFEQRVCPDRLWRYDIYCHNEKLAFEANGGKWHGGHRRRTKVDDEYEKLNRAQLSGVRVLQFSNEAILNGSAKDFLRKYLMTKTREWRVYDLTR